MAQSKQSIYFKALANFITIIIIVILARAFFTSLPLGLTHFNLPLVSLIFMLVMADLELALWWAVAIGFLSDLIAFNFFGAELISLPLVVLLGHLMFTRFFTNRSFYSFLGLATFSTAVYLALSTACNYLLALASGSRPELMASDLARSGLEQLGYNLLAVALGFYLVNYLSNRLKPVFLNKQPF